MVTQEILDAVKLRIRKTRSDVLDEDVRQLCAVAIADLKRIGVADKHLSATADPLIKEAIITYANANYGSNPDREKLMTSYDMLLTKIKGGHYRER